MAANGRELCLCTGQHRDPWVRGRENLNEKANLSHSPPQSRLFLISSVRAGTSSLAESQLTAGGGVQMLPLLASLLTFPVRPTGPCFGKHRELGRTPGFSVFLCWKEDAEQAHQRVALLLLLGAACLSCRTLLGGKMTYGFGSEATASSPSSLVISSRCTIGGMIR